MSFTNYTASFSAYTLVDNSLGSSPIGALIAIQVEPTAALALGVAAVTLRWNDGRARSEQVTCALVSLDNLSRVVIPIVIDAGEVATVEGAVTLGGSYRVSTSYISNF